MTPPPSFSEERLHARGPLTPAALAAAAGIAERYAREWLEQQAVAGLIAVDDAAQPAAERRYRMPAEHVGVLVDPEHAAHLAPFAEMAAGIGGALEHVVEAYRSGAGVPYEAYGAVFVSGQGGINRPAFMQDLTGAWLPAVPDLHRRLARLRIVAASCVVLTLIGACASAPPSGPAAAPAPRLDAVWVPSAPEVIAAMLKAAEVGPDDVVYDLGCGEGEIVIAAAVRYGARAVGVDLDPERITNARLNAARAGVTGRVTFIEQDLFATDVSPATVVTLYLGPEVNRRLRPKLLRELRPGARIVSHDFSLGDWTPERTIAVPQAPGHQVLLWRVPPR